MSRVGQAIGELPIVGHQEQPLGVAVEPPNREDARTVGEKRRQVGPALWIVERRDDARRFVEGVVPRLRVDVEGCAIHRDPIAIGLDPVP
jgi:hypothetical protein